MFTPSLDCVRRQCRGLEKFFPLVLQRCRDRCARSLVRRSCSRNNVVEPVGKNFSNPPHGLRTRSRAGVNTTSECAGYHPWKYHDRKRHCFLIFLLSSVYLLFHLEFAKYYVRLSYRILGMQKRKTVWVWGGVGLGWHHENTSSAD